MGYRIVVSKTGVGSGYLAYPEHEYTPASKEEATVFRTEKDARKMVEWYLQRWIFDTLAIEEVR